MGEIFLGEMRKRCRKSDSVSYIIVDDETGVPVMKKDMLKNKRIDEAQLEKVSGGVSLDTSKMNSYDTDRYKELLNYWGWCSHLFQNKEFEQSIFEMFWGEWRNADFEPDARTFLRNNEKRIMDFTHRR